MLLVPNLILIDISLLDEMIWCMFSLLYDEVDESSWHSFVADDVGFNTVVKATVSIGHLYEFVHNKEN